MLLWHVLSVLQKKAFQQETKVTWTTQQKTASALGLGKGNGALKSSHLKVQILWEAVWCEGHKIWRYLPPCFEIT